MTLRSYDPPMLEAIAMRLLDLAGVFRRMAHDGREYEINDFALHDKKANEWIANLEHWSRRVEADFSIRILETRAARRVVATRDGTEGPG